MRIYKFVNTALCALACLAIGTEAMAARHSSWSRPTSATATNTPIGSLYVVTSATGNSNNISGSTGPITVTQTSGPVIVNGGWGAAGDGYKNGQSEAGSSGASGSAGAGPSGVSVGTGVSAGLGIGVSTGGGAAVSTGASGSAGTSVGASTGSSGSSITSTGAQGGLVTVNVGTGSGAPSSTGAQGGLVNLNLGSGASGGGLLTVNTGGGDGTGGLVNVGLGTLGVTTDSTTSSPHRTPLQLCGACLTALTGGVGN